MVTAGTVLLGRYKVESFLGRGGMADVYLAFDTKRQAHVALKVLREDLAEDAEFVRRFRREAQALARLDHPYIVRFYAFEQQALTAFIVMDYVPGMTLRRRLAMAQEGLPLEEVTRILRQVGAALQYAHNEGYIHRDIKTGNIILREDGTALLSDFGIARAAETATMTMGAVGTPAYMSPEQVRGEGVDSRSDIYSLGVVLYEMLTGRRPFTGAEGGSTSGSTFERIWHEHLHATPPDPRRFNVQVPEAVVPVVMRALAKSPAKRWPDVMSMVRAWERALGLPHEQVVAGRPLAPVPEAKPARSSPRTPMPAHATPASGGTARPSVIPIQPWFALAGVVSITVVVLLALRVMVSGPGGGGPPSPVPSPAPTSTRGDGKAPGSMMGEDATATAAASITLKTEAAQRAQTLAVQWATATAGAELTIQALADEQTRATARAMEQTVTAAARATATRSARYTETAIVVEAATAAAEAAATERAVLQTREAATRMAQGTQTAVAAKTATARAQQVVAARATATRAAQLTATRIAVNATATVQARATLTAEALWAQQRCFEARRRHWEKSTSGGGEIAGIIYDLSGRPFSGATVHLYIANSNWETYVSVAADGIYNFCCLAFNPHNLHVVELIGGNISTVQRYSFYLTNLDQSRVLVDFYEVPCR